VPFYATAAVTIYTNPNRGSKLKYRRNANKLLIGLWDAHLDPDEEPSRAYKVCKRFILSMDPDYLYLVGDFGNMSSMSHHDKRRPLLLENKRYKRDVEQMGEEIEDLKLLAPNAEMEFFEGNHEFWTRKFIEENPSMEGELDLRSDLKLDERGIGWVPLNETKQVGEMFYAHGWKHTMYYAKATLAEFGSNIIVGHAHRPQTWITRKGSPIHSKPIMCMGVGILCHLNPPYIKKRVQDSKWVQGFGMVEYRDNGEFQAHQIIIVDGKITFGGYSWEV
jgi:hypothetical protein